MPLPLCVWWTWRQTSRNPVSFFKIASKLDLFSFKTKFTSVPVLCLKWLTKSFNAFCYINPSKNHPYHSYKKLELRLLAGWAEPRPGGRNTCYEDSRLILAPNPDGTTCNSLLLGGHITVANLTAHTASTSAHHHASQQSLQSSFLQAFKLKVLATRRPASVLEDSIWSSWALSSEHACLCQSWLISLLTSHLGPQPNGIMSKLLQVRAHQFEFNGS